MAVLTMIVSGVYVLACLLLILVVLLQRQGRRHRRRVRRGGTQAAFGARAGASLLTRVTTVLGTLFMAGSLLLAIIGQRGPGSVLGGLDAPEATPVEVEEPATLPEPAATDDESEKRGLGRDRRSAVAAPTPGSDARPRTRKWRNGRRASLRGW